MAIESCDRRAVLVFCIEIFRIRAQIIVSDKYFFSGQCSAVNALLLNQKLLNYFKFLTCVGMVEILTVYASQCGYE